MTQTRLWPDSLLSIPQRERKKTKPAMVAVRMTPPAASPDTHPFVHRPHHTFMTFTLPVMASLVVEPFASLVDTAFVERLGAASAAGLGAATALMSGVLWIFNFLGVGTQTEVAHAIGAGKAQRVGSVASLGLILAVLLGLGLTLLTWPGVERFSIWMSADVTVQTDAQVYLTIRLLGVVPSLVVTAAFGVLRGLQDMRMPLWIAGGMSLVNIVLDPILIFGIGSIPALGIAGAAWATILSQFIGMAWALWVIAKQTKLTSDFDWHRARRFFLIGRDLALRTGFAQIFMLASTWTALQISVEAGAAHQALRQLWMFLAFLLDAYAVTAQSLIGYFLGATRMDMARRAARLACWWALSTGGLLLLVLVLFDNLIAFLLVPPSTHSLFLTGLLICALTQPLNALSFVTDGIHWGTGDYAYLRNAMSAATGTGVLFLMLIDPTHAQAFTQVWLAMIIWIVIRSTFGLLRVWPGIGNAVLRLSAPHSAARR